MMRKYHDLSLPLHDENPRLLYNLRLDLHAVAMSLVLGFATKRGYHNRVAQQETQNATTRQNQTTANT